MGTVKVTQENLDSLVEAINNREKTDVVDTKLLKKLDSTANAVSASKLNTAYTIALSGDVTGSITFDGSADKIMTTEVADDSHNHIINNVDGLQTALDEKINISDIGVTVQAYDVNIVSDANYVHTDNNYTTTEKSKLANIEDGATADQTASEIKTAYESNSDTNNFDDSAKNKLANIEAGANKYVKPLSEAISYITNLQAELDKRVNKESGKSLVTDTVLAKLLSDVDALEELVNSDDTTLDTVQEIVDFISINRSTLEALSIGSIAGLQNALNGKIDDSQVLTNVPANAKFTDTVYSHPSTHPATMITTTDEFAYSNSTNVQDVLDDLDQAIANVNTKDPVITLTGDVTGSGTMTNLGNVSINATVGNDSHDHTRLLAVDDRDMKPNTSGINTHVKAIKAFFSSLGGMTGNDNTDYQDVLVLDTYSDTSGGNANAITMDKSSAAMRIWSASQNATSWGTGYRVFADNYHPNADKWTTARTLSLTGDVTGSTSFDGSGNVSIDATVANDSHTHSRIYDEGGSGNNLRVSSSNEIEFFNSSGTISDMYLNYSGSAGSVRGPGGATMLHTSNYNSYAPTKTGTGASGTWGINVTGNATTATTASNSNLLDNLDSTQFLRSDASSTLSGTIRVTGDILYDGGGNHMSIPFPKGAYYSTTASTVTGAIKIHFPTLDKSDMTSMWVDIYDYTTNESITVYVGWYASAGSNNPHAMILSTLPNKDFNVRFGNDATGNCVWIGETSSTWAYPQVRVRDVQMGYNADADNYFGTWSVSFATAFDTVDTTVTANYPVAGACTGNAATATTASNANALGSLALNSTTRNNEANKVCRTDTNGYANFGWINTTSGATTGTISDFYVNTNDGYIRKATKAHVASQMSGQTMNINGSSTACTGNAATATKLNATGGDGIQSLSSGKAYSSAVCMREAPSGTSNSDDIYAPRLGFHWGGLVASSIALRSDGGFKFVNNPGTGYENVYANIFYGSFSGDVAGNADTATWADTVDVNSGNTSSTWYDVVWHSGDSVYSSTGVEIQGSTNSLRASNLYATDMYVDDQILSTGDTDTYLQFHAADQWRVVTGGNERLEVNNSNITSSLNIITPSLSSSGDVSVGGDLKMTGSDSYIWTPTTANGFTGIWDSQNSRVVTKYINSTGDYEIHRPIHAKDDLHLGVSKESTIRYNATDKSIDFIIN